MIWRARQAPALEPFAAARRDSPDPRSRRHRRDKSRSAAQARRPETIGSHLLIRQSSPINASDWPGYTPVLLLRWQDGSLADQRQILASLRAEEIGIALS